MAWGQGNPNRLRGRAWMRIRQRVLLRDRYRCQTCIREGRPSPPDPSNEIDHVKPLDHGGSDSDDNLETICHDCHVRKTNGSRAQAVGISGDPVGGW